jgi:DNA-binding LytR/AlgR family response regulator
MNSDIIFHEYKIEIPVNGKMRIYTYADILYIIVSKPYCSICCNDGKRWLVSYGLNQFAKILPDIFFKCNRAAIINLSKIKEYSSQEIIMCNDTVIPLSRRKVNEFVNVMMSIRRLTEPFDMCLSCNLEDRCCKSFRAKLYNQDENITTI